MKEGGNVASPTVSLGGLFTTIVIDAYKGRDISTFDSPGASLHADIPKDKRFIKIKRDICGNNVSDQSGAQEEREVRNRSEGLIYVGITCHIWVHIIVSTVVQIILRNINGERFQTELI